MTYPSIEFLFFILFLGVFLAFLPRSLKIWFLLLASLIWIASWKISWVFIYLGISLFNFAAISLVQQIKRQFRDLSFISLIGLNIFIFIILKMGQLGPLHFNSPYGISFFLFMIMGLVLDKWRNESDREPLHFSHYMLFSTFFATLMGGPILRGKTFFAKLQALPDWSLERTIDGAILFSYGFLKFYLLSKSLADLNSDLAFWSKDSLYILVFMGLIGTLQAYVDFSSYCDMGRGVAKAFGIDLELNFRAIFFSANPNDYWQRWNITLGTWIRDYISFPVMLRYGRKINQQVLLFLTFIVVGLWHGISWNWLIFGIFNGAIVVIYNQINKWKTIPLLGRVLVWCIFIGNGLFQQRDFFLQLPSIIAERLYSRIGYIRWEELKNHFSLKIIACLGILLAIDLYQEKSKKSDWFTGINIFVKTIMVAAFLVWIFWGLSQNQFVEEVILPPVYFKI